MTEPQTPKSAVVPKKKFGQNFLVNQAIKQRVAQLMRSFAAKYDEQEILEIGPGQGDLTEFLVDFNRPITALEIDPEAVSFLKERFRGQTNLKIIQADALEMVESIISELSLVNGSTPLATAGTSQERNFSSALFDNRLLLANLPFNVGSRILVDLAVLAPQTPFCVILQKEVAQKTQKHQDFTLFGAWLNLFWDCKLVMDLPPQSFYPQPRVMSALLQGTPRIIQSLNLKVKNQDEIVWRAEQLAILKKLFANPRKTLSSNLKNLGWSKNRIAEFLSASNLNEKTRLNWDNYENILDWIIKFG